MTRGDSRDYGRSKHRVFCIIEEPDKNRKLYKDISISIDILSTFRVTTIIKISGY